MSATHSREVTRKVKVMAEIFNVPLTCIGVEDRGDYKAVGLNAEGRVYIRRQRRGASAKTYIASAQWGMYRITAIGKTEAAAKAAVVADLEKEDPMRRPGEEIWGYVCGCVDEFVPGVTQWL